MNNMKGQTLIEVLVALGLAGVVITAATIVVTASLNNAQFSRDQQLATNYAQEGMEIVRQIRGYDITGFRGYSGTYCLAKGQLTLSSPQSLCPTNVDIFTRSVVIEQSQCATNVARVSVNVAWTDGRCSSGGLCHKVPLVSCLSTVNPVTGP
jgi:prepilin-type N-terminal cleavage/methylation domain-containing protein